MQNTSSLKPQDWVDHVDPMGRPLIQWIGLRENLQESPMFNGKIYGFL